MSRGAEGFEPGASVRYCRVGGLETARELGYLVKLAPARPQLVLQRPATVPVHFGLLVRMSGLVEPETCLKETTFPGDLQIRGIPQIPLIDLRTATMPIEGKSILDTYSFLAPAVVSRTD
jgi:hypothetical protein